MNKKKGGIGKLRDLSETDNQSGLQVPQSWGSATVLAPGHHSRPFGKKHPRKKKVTFSPGLF